MGGDPGAGLAGVMIRRQDSIRAGTGMVGTTGQPRP
jgi:hypothetical protein